MKKFIIVMLFIVALISCDNQTSKVDDTNEKGIKIQIFNNSQNDLKDIVISSIKFNDLNANQTSDIIQVDTNNIRFLNLISFKASQGDKNNNYDLYIDPPTKDSKYILDSFDIDNGFPLIRKVDLD